MIYHLNKTIGILIGMTNMNTKSLRKMLNKMADSLKDKNTNAKKFHRVMSFLLVRNQYMVSNYQRLLII